MGNPFVHVELQTQDLGKAKKFYQGLFDWRLEDVPGIPPMGYTMVHVGEGTGGGMMKCPVSGAPSQWLPYILVDDVKASTKKAKGLGAKVVQDVTEVPNYGWFSVVADPTGATVGLWQVKDGK
jgi:predicted enzyme related to lactoylglutathione lyase